MIKNTRFLIVWFLIIVTGLYIKLHSDVEVPINIPFSEFPISSLGWQMMSQFVLDEEDLRVLKATDYLNREYIDHQGHHVYLYIGYHNGGKDSGSIHSPRHCLPSSGWVNIRSEKISLEIENRKLSLVRAIYRKDGENMLFLYWYQVKEKSLTDEYSLKLAEIMNSLFKRRRESALIRISVPFVANEKDASSVGIKFVKDFYPTIESFLPK